jgi:polyphosphate glucokinase
MRQASEAFDAILAVDIGGTGLKAALIDRRGGMLTERVRVETPHPSPPNTIVHTLGVLVRPLLADARVGAVSVGFPGIVHGGKISTAPNLGTDEWRGFPLARALEKQWQKPVRVINDADMQGLGAASGKGIEMVITLGTGFGTAILGDGRLAPHLELAHHPFRKGKTYEEELGDAARQKAGKKKWSKHVAEAIENLYRLTNFDRLYIGGGNAKKLELELPPHVLIVGNECGMKGGAKLWRD